MNQESNQPSTAPASGQTESAPVLAPVSLKIRKLAYKPRVKPRSNMIFPKLKPKQRQQIYKWLFEDNLSYRGVVKKMETEMNIKISYKPIQQFYYSEVNKQRVAEMMQDTKFAQEIVEASDEKAELMFRALLILLLQLAFRAAKPKAPGEKADLATAMELLPLLIEARKDAREDRKAALDRERWEFDVVRMCHVHFDALQVIIANESLDEPERLDAIRKQLFAPGPKPMTEN